MNEKLLRLFATCAHSNIINYCSTIINVVFIDLRYFDVIGQISKIVLSINRFMYHGYNK